MDKTKGIDTSKMNENQIVNLKKITRNLMHLFEQSIGCKFRVKGTPLIDEVTGVNWELELVKGKQYGEFHVHLCEITNTNDTSLTN